MTRRAVVLGSNGPKGPDKLKYAEDDADKISQALSGARCRFQVTRILGTDEPSVIQQKISMIAAECNEDDVVVFYFSGHGFIESGGLFLMLDNTSFQSPFLSALHIDLILLPLRFSRARHKLLILDCCHAGMMHIGGRLKSATPRVELQPFLTRGPEGAVSASSFVALLASNHFERAREADAIGGSFLAWSIYRALGESYSDADRDGDGALSLTDLARWLAEEAGAYNRKNKGAAVPTPYLYGETRGDLYLSVNPKAWEPAAVSSAAGAQMMVLPVLYDRESAWCIARTPVTNKEYESFLRASGGRSPVGRRFRGRDWDESFEPWRDERFSGPTQPVVCVSYADASSYCDWASKECGRPITVAPARIWTFVAYAKVDGMSYRRMSDLGIREALMSGHFRAECTAPVDRGGASTNALGVVDLFGNVWEWCSNGRTWYPDDELTDRMPVLSPFFPLVAQDALAEFWMRSARAYLAPWSWMMPGATAGADPAESQRSRHSAWSDKVHGGGYVENPLEVEPEISVYGLSRGDGTRHSDLGFRTACVIPVKDLPFGTQIFLESASVLDAMDRRVSRSSI